MADTKISALTELAVPPDPTDEFVVVDKSDTSEAASGTDKRILGQTLIDRAVAAGMSGIPPTGVTFQNYSRYIPTQSETTGPLASGQLRLQAIWLPAGFTVTSISWMCGGTALTTSGTGPHFWFALFDSSRALLRQANDDTAATWALRTLKTVNLSSTFVTTYTGVHYIGAMCVSGSTGTQPTIYGHSLTNAFLGGLAPIIGGTSTASLTTTAPNPAAAITVTTGQMWCGVA